MTLTTKGEVESRHRIVHIANKCQAGLVTRIIQRRWGDPPRCFAVKHQLDKVGLWMGNYLNRHKLSFIYIYINNEPLHLNLDPKNVKLSHSFIVYLK